MSKPIVVRHTRWVKSGMGTLAKKVKKLEKKVKASPMNWKWRTFGATNLTTSLATATPLVYLLNGVAEGTDETNTRVGDKIKFNHLDLWVNVVRLNATAAECCQVRILVVREKTALGSAIGLAQLMSQSAPQLYDNWNTTTRDHSRFVVVYDKMITLGAKVLSTATTNLYNNAAPNVASVHIQKKLSFVTDYSRGNAGTVADIDTNSLYLICLTNWTGATDIAVNASMNLKFLDS